MVMMDLFAEGYIYIDNCISETIESINKNINIKKRKMNLFIYTFNSF